MGWLGGMRKHDQVTLYQDSNPRAPSVSFGDLHAEPFGVLSSFDKCNVMDISLGATFQWCGPSSNTWFTNDTRFLNVTISNFQSELW